MEKKETFTLCAVQKEICPFYYPNTTYKGFDGDDVNFETINYLHHVTDLEKDDAVNIEHYLERSDLLTIAEAYVNKNQELKTQEKLERITEIFQSETNAEVSIEQNRKVILTFPSGKKIDLCVNHLEIL